MITHKSIVIIGPTSSGKTSKALELCRQFNGEIISADSRQLYKGMDIGTGKLPLSQGNVKIDKAEGHWDFDDVRIWLYDVVTPGEYFSALDFKNKSEEIMLDIWKRGKVPFVVGGTGFYIETLLGTKSVAATQPDFKLREELSKYSVSELSDKLQMLDPIAWERVDRNNPRRLQRAIEVATVGALPAKPAKPATRSVLRVQQAEPLHLVLGLSASHGILYPRVDAWVDASVKAGLVDETRRLIDQGYENTPQLNGLIYKVVKSYLAGKVTASDMLQLIKYQLHDYIRRQETYFRKIPGVTWLDVSKETFDAELINKVESYLDG